MQAATKQSSGRNEHLVMMRQIIVRVCRQIADASREGITNRPKAREERLLRRYLSQQLVRKYGLHRHAFAERQMMTKE
jgi:hypothetical protein